MSNQSLIHQNPSSCPGGFAGECNFGGANRFTLHARSHQFCGDFHVGQQLRVEVGTCDSEDFLSHRLTLPA